MSAGGRPVLAFGADHQDLLRSARRIVVKVGSSLVTNEGRGLDESAIGEWCRQLAALMRDGREVIMVSFSLMTGTTPSASRVTSVERAFR